MIAVLELWEECSWSKTTDQSIHALHATFKSQKVKISWMHGSTYISFTLCKFPFLQLLKFEKEKKMNVKDFVCRYNVVIAEVPVLYHDDLFSGHEVSCVNCCALLGWRNPAPPPDQLPGDEIMPAFVFEHGRVAPPPDNLPQDWVSSLYNEFDLILMDWVYLSLSNQNVFFFLGVLSFLDCKEASMRFLGDIWHYIYTYFPLLQCILWLDGSETDK